MKNPHSLQKPVKSSKSKKPAKLFLPTMSCWCKGFNKEFDYLSTLFSGSFCVVTWFMLVMNDEQTSLIIK